MQRKILRSWFSDDVSGEMTCALTILKTEGGRLHGGIDIRFPIDKTLAEISGIITSALESKGFKVDELDGMEPHYVDENSEFVQTLLRVYERSRAKRKMYRRGRNNLRSQHKGRCCVRCGIS